MSARDERRAVAVPPMSDEARVRAAERDWHVELLDVEDPDERAMLIRLAHPEIDEAIDEGAELVRVGGAEMNPRLHLAIHEVVATQIIENDPPEMFATAQRLLALGRDPHEVLHMLGSTVAEQIWAVTHEEQAYSRAAQAEALAALPGTWDAQAASPAPLPRRTVGRRRRRR